MTNVVPEIRLLGAGEAAILDRVAEDVFDDPIVPRVAAAFLADERHHIAVALVDGVVVGMVTAVDYLHPDKASPELWINEVAVAPPFQGQGVGGGMLRAILAEGERRGCVEAWVLTERSNPVAMRLYQSCGGVAAPEDAVMFEFPLQPR